MTQTLTPFATLFPTAPIIEIIDVGSNALAREVFPPIYFPLLQTKVAHVTGFDPGEEAFAHLQQLSSEQERYFPYAIGDGTTQTFYECAYDSMSSLYEPNADLLRHFQVLDKAAEIKSTFQIETKRLDDIVELTACDYIHIDVQGAELQCFQGAEKLLQHTLFIQAETNFLPMYKNQPLFSEVELYLRQQGFMLHSLANQQTRLWRPVIVKDKPFAGLRQLFWADALFVRDITSWPQLDAGALLKLASLLHLYRSYDLAYLALQMCDTTHGTQHQAIYAQFLAQEQGAYTLESAQPEE